MASGSQALSQRTDEQAASLRQTVATVSQLSAAVVSNAEAAQQLDGVAGKLRVQAEAGGEAMRATVGSMSALKSSSKRVGEIIGVIDGISFQTNILRSMRRWKRRAPARPGAASRWWLPRCAAWRSATRRGGRDPQADRRIDPAGRRSVTRIENVSATLASRWSAACRTSPNSCAASPRPAPSRARACAR